MHTAGAQGRLCCAGTTGTGRNSNILQLFHAKSKTLGSLSSSRGHQQHLPLPSRDRALPDQQQDTGLCWAAQGSGVNGVRRVLHPGHGPRAASPCHGAREELGGCHLCWHCPVLVLVFVPQTLPMACPPREERRTGAYLAGNFNQISDLEPVFCFTNAIKESNCINQNHIILPIIKFPLTPLFTLPLLIN